MKLDEGVVNAVWHGAKAIAGQDPAMWRRDPFGRLICRSEYGQADACFGWFIGRINRPVTRAGIPVSDYVALHWRFWNDKERTGSAVVDDVVAYDPVPSNSLNATIGLEKPPRPNVRRLQNAARATIR